MKKLIPLKKYMYFSRLAAVTLLCCGICGCGEKQQPKDEPPGASDPTVQETPPQGGEQTGASGTDRTNQPLTDDGADPEPLPPQTRALIDPEGTTLETRILPPEGYEPVAADDGSLAEFLRTYPLKEAGSPVLLYNGQEKGNQNAHAAVLALPIEPEDLQQCADSVMRVYAEYFWSTGAYDKIRFHFTSGFLAEYPKWRDGYRIQVDGNQVNWTKTAAPDDSYECLVSYLRMVFSYAGTLSMEQESSPIALSALQAGDVFLMGGSPGHVVMVLNICENAAGEKAFLLGQGYMPAQEFHVLKNPAHEDDPWYYETDVTYPFVTPEYVFAEGSLRRLSY